METKFYQQNNRSNSQQRPRVYNQQQFAQQFGQQAQHTRPFIDRSGEVRFRITYEYLSSEGKPVRGELNPYGMPRYKFKPVWYEGVEVVFERELNDRINVLKTIANGKMYRKIEYEKINE